MPVRRSAAQRAGYRSEVTSRVGQRIRAQVELPARMVLVDGFADRSGQPGFKPRQLLGNRLAVGRYRPGDGVPSPGLPEAPQRLGELGRTQNQAQLARAAFQIEERLVQLFKPSGALGKKAYVARVRAKRAKGLRQLKGCRLVTGVAAQGLPKRAGGASHIARFVRQVTAHQPNVGMG